jgi:hypothetical protein
MFVPVAARTHQLGCRAGRRSARRVPVRSRTPPCPAIFLSLLTPPCPAIFLSLLVNWLLDYYLTFGSVQPGRTCMCTITSLLVAPDVPNVQYIRPRAEMGRFEAAGHGRFIFHSFHSMGDEMKLGSWLVRCLGWRRRACRACQRSVRGSLSCPIAGDGSVYVLHGGYPRA